MDELRSALLAAFDPILREMPEHNRTEHEQINRELVEAVLTVLAGQRGQ